MNHLIKQIISTMGNPWNLVFWFISPFKILQFYAENFDYIIGIGCLLLHENAISNKCLN